MSYLFLHGNGVYLYIANMLIEAYIYYTTKINSLIDKITLSNYFDKKELATFAFLNIKQGKYGYCVDINNTSSMNIQEIWFLLNCLNESFYVLVPNVTTKVVPRTAPVQMDMVYAVLVSSAKCNRITC